MLSGLALLLPTRNNVGEHWGGGVLPTRGALVPAVAQKTSTRRKMTEMDSASSFQNVTLPHSLAAVFSASGTC